ncbi:hypothetical protein I4U23_018118 [Adineta vaga]|nr:hypothetical protein I4U23_018118 [Adineta vaga]
MSLSDSNMKTTTSPTKRFQFTMIVDQVLKFFASSQRAQDKPMKPNSLIVLPSISVTTPEGKTSVVE